MIETSTPGSRLWRLSSENCPSGWRSSRSLTPSPWIALASRAHLILDRHPISEPGRYYHHEGVIVIRAGMLLEEERRHLWHELVHADHGDEQRHACGRWEDAVEREAARRAMPLPTLLWAFGLAHDWHTAANLLKLPETWVRWYVDQVLDDDAHEQLRVASNRARESA